MTEPLTTELAHRKDAGALDPFMPVNAGEAMQMATMLANSGLLGKNTPPRPESVLLLMARGHALGMSVGQSLFAFHIIDGVPTLKAESQQAICLARTDVCEEFALIDTSASHATYRAQRRGGESITMSYTWDDAVRAGLTTGNNAKTWEKNPAAMLRARCITAIGQAVFPDLLLGLSSPEEQAQAAEARGQVIEVDRETGEPRAETPDDVRRRAQRDVVKNDLRDIRATGGESTRRRLDAQAATEEAAASGHPGPTEADVEAMLEQVQAETAQNPPTAPQAAPEPASPAREPDPDTAGDREALVRALEVMTKEERVAFWEKHKMSPQSANTIRDRLSPDLVGKLLAGIRA